MGSSGHGEDHPGGRAGGVASGGGTGRGKGGPGETVAGKAAAAGAADARDGGSSGLPADPDEPLYFQGSAGVPGTAETGDQFAAALSA